MIITFFLCTYIYMIYVVAMKGIEFLYIKIKCGNLPQPLIAILTVPISLGNYM